LGNVLKKDVNVSFEFFPPKTESMQIRLWHTLQQLTPLHPKFVSVTYGAGGSTRELTHTTVKRIVLETAVPTAAHLTCVSATKQQVLSVADEYWQAGVRHIVALRGDPPSGIGEKFLPHPDGFKGSVDLIQSLRSRGEKAAGGFEISVSCYPELHPENMGWAAELDHLKAKQHAGANQAITQFFFDSTVYLRFLDKVTSADITMPIIPGIMLQPNFAGLKRMASLCGTTMPHSLCTQYEKYQHDESAINELTVHTAAEMCQHLVNQGVQNLHFYTLNRADLALKTCELLGLDKKASKNQ
jgi:methylenetetrahydrofolate reductase (NADPH)